MKKLKKNFNDDIKIKNIEDLFKDIVKNSENYMVIGNMSAAMTTCYYKSVFKTDK